MQRMVLDTDIVVAALRSPRGGAAEVLRLARVGQLQLVASVAVVLEYEAVVTRAEQLSAIGASRQQVLSALDDIAAVADEVHSYFSWRPQVRDAADEMVLEAAINGRARFLMTFKRRDFGTAPARFGIRLCKPAQYLRSLRA